VIFSGKDGKRERFTYPARILARTTGLRRKLAVFGSGDGAVVPAFGQGGGVSTFSAMLPETGGADDPERLEIFVLKGPPASAGLLRAQFAFRDFGAPYRRGGK